MHLLRLYLCIHISSLAVWALAADPSPVNPSRCRALVELAAGQNTSNKSSTSAGDSIAGSKLQQNKLNAHLRKLNHPEITRIVKQIEDAELANSTITSQYFKHMQKLSREIQEAKAFGDEARVAELNAEKKATVLRQLERSKKMEHDKAELLLEAHKYRDSMPLADQLTLDQILKARFDFVEKFDEAARNTKGEVITNSGPVKLPLSKHAEDFEKLLNSQSLDDEIKLTPKQSWAFEHAQNPKVDGEATLRRAGFDQEAIDIALKAEVIKAPGQKILEALDAEIEKSPLVENGGRKSADARALEMHHKTIHTLLKEKAWLERIPPSERHRFYNKLQAFLDAGGRFTSAISRNNEGSFTVDAISGSPIIGLNMGKLGEPTVFASLLDHELDHFAFVERSTRDYSEKRNVSDLSVARIGAYHQHLLRKSTYAMESSAIQKQLQSFDDRIAVLTAEHDRLKSEADFSISGIGAMDAAEQVGMEIKNLKAYRQRIKSYAARAQISETFQAVAGRASDGKLSFDQRQSSQIANHIQEMTDIAAEDPYFVHNQNSVVNSGTLKRLNQKFLDMIDAQDPELIKNLDSSQLDELKLDMQSILLRRLSSKPGVKLSPEVHALARRQTKVLKFKNEDQGVSIEGQYLWDNWGHYDAKQGRYFQYALSAPRSVGDPSARHTQARIRIMSSKDNVHWEDHGLFMPDTWNWSGQSKVINGQTHLFHTRPAQRENDITQSIMVAKSKDGIHFEKAETLLDPSKPQTRTRAEELGYVLGNDDGLISAWRDPYHSDDSIFFATKTRHPDTGEIIPTVARAKSASGDLSDLELQKPIILPLDYNKITQVEVPNITRLPDGRYLMSANLASRASDLSPSNEVDSWVRFFVADKLEGPWERAQGPSFDKDGNLFDADSRVYGFNMLQNTPNGELVGRGFYRSHQEMTSNMANGATATNHTLTPLMKIEIDPKSPSRDQ